MNPFKVQLEVRDNEIDIQGIVNNTNYFIYFQHARHKFLAKHGISFIEMANQKQFLVLVSTTIEFKKSLISEDIFYVTCKLVPESKIRIAFEQEIINVADNTLIATSRHIGTCLDGTNNNKPYLPESLKKLMQG